MKPSAVVFAAGARNGAPHSRPDLDLCECGCWAPHRTSGCTGLDSYGIPCTCPSFEPLPDDEDEDG